MKALRLHAIGAGGTMVARKKGAKGACPACGGTVVCVDVGAPSHDRGWEHISETQCHGPQDQWAARTARGLAGLAKARAVGMLEVVRDDRAVLLHEGPHPGVAGVNAGLAKRHTKPLWFVDGRHVAAWTTGACPGGEWSTFLLAPEWGGFARMWFGRDEPVVLYRGRQPWLLGPLMDWTIRPKRGEMAGVECAVVYADPIPEPDVVAWLATGAPMARDRKTAPSYFPDRAIIL